MGPPLPPGLCAQESFLAVLKWTIREAEDLAQVGRWKASIRPTHCPTSSPDSVLDHILVLAERNSDIG